MQSDTTDMRHIDAYRLACTPLAFQSPYYQHLSAWHEHLPFAFWLVENLQPKTVVELGTHYGVSYFAFCQAVKQLLLDTRCFAVDTWQGDSHAGKYDEAVYSLVAAYNNEHYSAFSRLIRSLFDKALSHFQDGEIDLLHIDGHHSYESVKHDFDSWLPKMSEKSVVLLHDTNVREKGFGVFRLFEELRNRYPHFEFVHGHGLAIIGTGEKCGQHLQKLFELQHQPDARVSLMNIFARLGRTCADSVRLKEQSTEISNLKQKAIDEQTQFEAQLSKARSENDSHVAKLDVLEMQAEATKKKNEFLTQELLANSNSTTALVQQHDLDEREINELQSKIAEIESHRNVLLAEIEDLQKRLAAESFLLEHQAAEYSAETAIRFEEIAILTRMVANLEKLQPENAFLRQAAVDEIGKIVSALAPTGPQRSILGKWRVKRFGILLDKADFFDAKWYADRYSDVAKAKVNPSRHYLEYGVREGRLPNSKFDK